VSPRANTLHSTLKLKIPWAILAIGLCIAVASGWAWQASAQKLQRQSFDLISSNVGAQMDATLRQNMDLVATAQAMIATNPNANNEQFVQFMTAVGASTRYKNSVVVGYFERIPESQLGTFWASIGSPVLGTSASAGVLPPGDRAQYCLLRASALQVLGLGIYSIGASIPAGTDYCAAPAASKMLQAAEDSGRLIVTSVASGLSAVKASLRLPDVSKLPPAAQQDIKTVIATLFRADVVVAPVYRSGAPISTVADRRSALVGWALDVLDTHGIVAQGLGTSQFHATLSHVNPGSAPMTLVSTGHGQERGIYTKTIRSDIDGQWAITLSGKPPAEGISPLGQGVLVGAVVLIISLLLFSLLWVQGRSRTRALALVDQKTGQLAHQALHDSLTGLPNRALIVDRAEQMLARAARQRLQIGALFLDLDNFKAINDGLGHAAGDHLLQAVGARLQGVLRGSDTVGRLGGDEFVVLVEGESLDVGPEIVAERLMEVLQEPFVLDGLPDIALTITASIGIALGATSPAEDLLRDADVALYEAKAAGKNCHRVFRSEMQHAISDRLELEMDLRSALENEEFFVLYQPIFDLEHESIAAVEALLRWRHPTRGVVAPDVFIPIAEDTGLIVPIGRWVLIEACRQADGWHRLGKPLGMSVNISGRQLERDDLGAHVQEALAISGLPPSFLTLEITETTLMRDTEATIRRLRFLKDLGVRLAVDDFGTGYSSLAYLRQFPVDALKIDRSFIAGIAESSESGALIHTLIHLGKTLGMETLAEGIEDQAQLVRLQREHCDTGQGFLLARPLDVTAMEEFLDVRRQDLTVP
jgi:diguanylate cyclase (GGDEF)-like protein